MLHSGINDILIELRESSSSKYKISVLEKHLDNELLKKVLLYTYTPYSQYHIKQLPEIVSVMNEGDEYISLESGLEFLDKLSNREITGNDARLQLSYIVDNMRVEDAQVLLRIVDRNLDCGINDATINKVFKGLIPEIPYMRCEKYTDKTVSKITYPAYIQLKADGSFINIIKHNKNVYCMSRSGTVIHIGKVSEFYQNMIADDNFVIMGEVVLVDKNGVMPRKTGNGLINSYAKRETTRQSILDKQKELVKKGKGASSTFKKLANDLHAKEEEWKMIENSMQIECWDCVPYEDWERGIYPNVPYETRFEHNLKELIKECPFITPIWTEVVNSLDEAQKFARNRFKEGLEGGVLKNKLGIWEDGTSKDQIKIKAVREADLLITSYVPGEGDFEGGIGALIGYTSDNLLVSSVGSGLTREGRGLERVDENDMAKGIRLRNDIISIDDFFEKEYNNQIMAVKYNELSKSDENEYWTLSHPVFVEVRTDKFVADTLERLQDKGIK